MVITLPSCYGPPEPAEAGFICTVSPRDSETRLLCSHMAKTGFLLLTPQAGLEELMLLSALIKVKGLCYHVLSGWGNPSLPRETSDVASGHVNSLLLPPKFTWGHGPV